MDESPLKPARSLWPRYTLLTVLLIMTIVGLAIVVALQWREVGPLRAEVHQLRDELGVLIVDDPAKVCAIQIETNNQLIWKWRLWIPEKHSATVKVSGDTIPNAGFPLDFGSVDLTAGEQTPTYRIQRDPRDNNWHGDLTCERRGSSSGIGAYLQPWVDWGNVNSNSGGVSRRTESVDAGKTVVLRRHRVWEPTKIGKMPDPSAGFMIWLETSK